MRLLFTRGDSSLRLLEQLVVMQLDLDMAEHFYLRVKFHNGTTVAESIRSRKLGSPEAVRSFGLWSLTLVFNIFGRAFLHRFAVDEEARKLLIIDRIVPKEVLHQILPSVEVLAFDTLALVLEIGGVDSVMVPNLLETVLSREENQQWCAKLANANDRQRWAKQKAGKYCKLITRFKKKSAQLRIQTYLAARTCSVEYLLGKLHLSISHARKVPTKLEQEIEATKDPGKIMNGERFLLPWTQQDLNLTRQHI